MFQGSIPALVTPMTADGAIDFAAWDRVLDFHLRAGTDAVVVGGTTGESPTLERAEIEELVRRAKARLAGRMPVIAGSGTNSTAKTIALSKAVVAAGADALLLVTPYYNKPTQEGLYLHHKAVAEAVPIPQILYNVPGRTAVDMLPETVARLAQIPNIVGLKDATGNLQRARELLDLCGGKIDLYSGDDNTAMEFMLMGGKGDISVTANVAPRAMHEMCAAALAGDRARAEPINTRLAALHKDLFVESNPIPVKWALYAMGLIPPGIRLPMTLLSARHQETVRAALRAAQVL